MSRPPLPPLTRETTAQKARMAEDAWNSCDPERVSVGEDRVLHLNTSFTWAYLDLGVYAHTRVKGCLCPTRRDLNPRCTIASPSQSRWHGRGAAMRCMWCPRSPHDQFPTSRAQCLEPTRINTSAERRRWIPRYSDEHTQFETAFGARASDMRAKSQQLIRLRANFAIGMLP
jgi:hypothetical protein